MLIKYYGFAFPNNLNIIDSVTDILVHAGLETATPEALPCGPHVDHAGIKNTYLYDTDKELFGDPRSGGTHEPVQPKFLAAKFIDFTRNGLRCRLSVYGYAYVCNDEGRTIEKVDPCNRV